MKNLIYLFLSLILILSGCETARIEPEEENSPPEVLSVTSDKTSVYPGEKIHLSCVAVDPDNNILDYEWNDGGCGIFYSNGTSSTIWEAPETDHDFLVNIYVFVQDEEEMARGFVQITVLADEPEEPEEPEAEYSYYIRYVCDDAYVNEQFPDENYGNEPNLSTGPEYYTYLRFDIQDIFDYIHSDHLNSIERVEIRMAKGYNNTVEKPVGTTEVYGISWSETLWMEEFVTANTAPEYEDKIAEVRNITFDVDGIVAFNVKTDFLQRVQLHNYYSVMIHTPNPSLNSSCYFYSKELGELYPEYEDSATPALWVEYRSN